MRIRFLSDQVYERDGIGKGPLFKAGSVLDAPGVGKALGFDASEDYAKAFLARWINRNVAVIEPDVKPEPIAPIVKGNTFEEREEPAPVKRGRPAKAADE